MKIAGLEVICGTCQDFDACGVCNNPEVNVFLTESHYTPRQAHLLSYQSLAAPDCVEQAYQWMLRQPPQLCWQPRMLTREERYIEDPAHIAGIIHLTAQLQSSPHGKNPEGYFD